MCAKVLEDENFDPSLVFLAREGEKIQGFLLAVHRRTPYLDRGLEPELGWITALGVRPEARGQGIAGELLRRAEVRLVALGVRTVVLGAYSPHYFLPGIDLKHYAQAVPFFEEHGYLGGEECYAMRRLLFGYGIPPEVAEKEQRARAAGYRFQPYEEVYRQKLLDFLAENFSAGWQYNARCLLEEGLGEEQIWICVDRDGQVAGYCQRGMDGNVSRFGPFGVRATDRNHSLGSILFCRMLYDMACRGIYLMHFLSTDAPGARFYRRQGLEVYRTFRHYQKELT